MFFTVVLPHFDRTPKFLLSSSTLLRKLIYFCQGRFCFRH